MPDDELPDPLAPGMSWPPRDPAPPIPRGDVRVASWVALGTGIVVVLWYLSILIFSDSLTEDVAIPLQVSMWVFALVSFVCGIVSLNARRARELAAAGFVAGVVALLVTLAIGLPAGLQIVF